MGVLNMRIAESLTTLSLKTTLLPGGVAVGPVQASTAAAAKNPPTSIRKPATTFLNTPEYLLMHIVYGLLCFLHMAAAVHNYCAGVVVASCADGSDVGSTAGSSLAGAGATSGVVVAIGSGAGSTAGVSTITVRVEVAVPKPLVATY